MIFCSWNAFSPHLYSRTCKYFIASGSCITEQENLRLWKLACFFAAFSLFIVVLSISCLVDLGTESQPIHFLKKGLNYFRELIFCLYVNSHFRSKMVSVKQIYQYPDLQPDDEDALSREPYVVWFSSPKTGETLLSVHYPPSVSFITHKQRYRKRMSTREAPDLYFRLHWWAPNGKP